MGTKLVLGTLLGHLNRSGALAVLGDFLLALDVGNAAAKHRASQDKSRSFHTVQAEFTMRTLDRVSGVSIHGCLTSCALVFYSVLVHPVCVSPPASSPPHITVTQLPLAI